MKALKNTIAEMGVSINCYSAATLTLGTVTLIGSLAFQGVIWVGNGLERIEKPVQRVGIMSGLIIGASAVGCILGAAMSGVITREDLIAKEVSLERMEKELKLERERSAFIKAGREHQENYLKAQIEEKDRTIKQLRSEFSALRREFLELRDIRVHLDNVRTLDNRYNILDCYDCKHFYGKKDGGKYFVCAMHPYGQKDCPERE
jgi:hypothetical protein